MQETKEINKVIYLNNNDILPNRFQPRKYFDEEEIMQLSESIKEHGVINPVIVRKLGDKYELVAGERRYKANILAGNDDIPAIIMDVNDKESSEIAVVENIQRKDLNAIEEAISYKRILDIGYMTQAQLAQKMGKSQAAIANKIRLLKLSDEVQDALMKKEISERHARSLLKLESHKKQNELLQRIINERLTVRKTDEEIEKMNNNMNENINSIYNNNQNSIFNGITPVMPETNISDVNITGSNQQVSVDNNIYRENNNMNNVSINSEIPNFSEPIVNNSVEKPIVSENSFATREKETESVPTISIDDVLAKANQPSVVGNEAFNSEQNQVLNNNQSDIPNLSPINESPTPIADSSIDNSVLTNPNINSINENSSGSESINIEDNNKAPENNVNMQNPMGFEMPILNPISENPEAVDNFINSTSFNENNLVNENIKSGIPDNSNTTNSSINTFDTFNLNQNNNTSPINTSPIIDTTIKSNDEFQQSGLEMNDNLSNNIPSQPQVQFEKVPEPIIVNEYNEQYDPIMPKNQNTQPKIDFKTIINLIRKCSQAIENSGYKIETEEYNLDNLYQVVFKIDKM